MRAIGVSKSLVEVVPAWQMTGARIISVSHGRDEESNLPHVFRSLTAQTLPPYRIIYVDDGSIDNSVSIAKSFATDIIELKERHKSYVGLPMLATTINKAFEYIDENEIEGDYIFIAGTDVVYPPHYLESLVDKIESDPKIVVASGRIEGEFNYNTHVRGAGRLYKKWFWDRFLKRHPIIYGWESYPLFKARSLGFFTRSFPGIKYRALRPTRSCKEVYGYAMKQLGYPLWYAIGRCLLSFLKDRNTGVRMLKAFFDCRTVQCDEAVSRYVKKFQFQQLLQVIVNPRILLRRLRS